MQPFVIFNPAASFGRAHRQWPRIEGALREAIGDYHRVDTAGPGHARELAGAAVAGGPRLVVAIGGDGTIGETVDGLLGSGEAAPPGVRFGFVAIGTGNDYRRSLGAGGDYLADIARLGGGHERVVDVGRLRYVADDGGAAVRHFVNVASFGISGAINLAVVQAKGSRLLGPKLLLFYQTVVTLLGYRFPNVRLAIDDTFDASTRVALVAVAIGNHFGAGMKIAPDADPADGLFDIVVVRGDGKAHLIASMPKLYDGTHVFDRAVTVLRGRSVTATPVDDQSVLLDVDGDTPGRLPASFDILPRALTLRG